MYGQLCTCDVENYGDLLYPILFRMLAEKHGVDSSILPLGFIEGPAPCGSNYIVHDFNRVINSPLSHLVIGGGDILRTDLLGIATHYIYNQKRCNPLFYQLKKAVLGKEYLREEFVKHHMGYSSISPFILNKKHHSAIGSIVYCSCGVPFRFPSNMTDVVREAFESADFIYLRDFASRDKLREIGVNCDIEVAPDLIVTLSDFFDLNDERSKGIDLLDRYSIDISKEIICFQSCPQKRDLDEILLHLGELKKRTGAEIVLMPIGYCHKDDVFLQKVAKRSGGSLKYIGPDSIYEMISVIAASSCFIGTSMHGNITAFSFGIPHLFGPIGVDKAEGFLNMVGLGAEFKLGSWSQLVDKHAMTAGLPRDHFATRADEAKKSVYTSLSKLFNILKN